MASKISSLIGGTFLFISVWLPSAVAQNTSNAAKNTGYLALGDSLAFGYNPLIQPPDLSQYVGYPEIIASALRMSLANASCPGETSGTFAGTSMEYYPGFNCATLRANNGLFVPYNGAQTQLDYAVAYLQANPNPKLVTIDIGGNDLGILQATCTANYNGNLAGILLCEETGLPGVLATFGRNLTLIYSCLRATGYAGTIIAMNYYAFNYLDPVQVAAFTALNTVIAAVSTPFGVHVGNAYLAFQLATTYSRGDACAAGLLIKLQNGTCDTHPSLAGQALLAATMLTAYY